MFSLMLLVIIISNLAIVLYIVVCYCLTILLMLMVMLNAAKVMSSGIVFQWGELKGKCDDGNRTQLSFRRFREIDLAKLQCEARQDCTGIQVFLSSKIYKLLNETPCDEKSLSHVSNAEYFSLGGLINS